MKSIKDYLNDVLLKNSMKFVNKKDILKKKKSDKKIIKNNFKKDKISGLSKFIKE